MLASKASVVGSTPALNDKDGHGEIGSRASLRN